MAVNSILQRFMEQSPIPVMVRILLERVLSADKLDLLFSRSTQKQYCRDLLFSSLFDLMGLVVTKTFPSINAAYVSQNVDIGVSLASVYNKLNSLELSVSEALVQDTAIDMASIIDDVGGRCKPLLPGHRIKMIDGNCIEGTEHRLAVLRDKSSGALPGKALVVYEPELELIRHIFPCEDGHAQERSLLNDVLKTVEDDDVFVADRNFCVRTFMQGIHDKGGYFIIRHHAQVPYEECTELKYVGDSDTGKLFEQWVSIEGKDGVKLKCRRVVVKLKSKTRNGDKELALLTTLPKKGALADIIASLYRKRWSIETMFQQLESYLNSEINALGYPKAALFGFSMAIVAFNIMSVVKASLRRVHGEDKIQKEVSGYYIAGEISRTHEGMVIAVTQNEWEIFHKMTDKEFASSLIDLAGNVVLGKYKKSKRGPKKPSPAKKSGPRESHVSTYKLLKK
jgi:hypothetical protein